MRPFLLGLLCLPLALAQSPAPPAKPATPPDRAAFQAATSEKDPSKKIAALEKFLAGFPDSRMMTTMARRELVSTALKQDPAQGVAKAASLTASLPSNDAAVINRFLASELIAAKKLLPEAETAALLALRQFNFDEFAAGARKDAEDYKQSPPSADQLKVRFHSQTAQYKETAGQVMIETGKTAEARAMLLDALRSNPALTNSAAALASLAEKEGKAPEALGYFAHAMLAKPSPASRTAFAAAWKKLKGDLDPTSYLDDLYRTAFKSPIHPEQYGASPKRSTRIVLGEIYTGAGCPPCVAADLAFDFVLERYPRSDVAIVAYHEHIPRPDPMANTDTIARWKWQQGRGVPTYAIDGEPVGMGGGGRDSAGEIAHLLRGKIDARLETAPGARLNLSVSHKGNAVEAKARVDKAAASPDLVLNIVLVEKELTYSGENGIRFHPMVARSIASYPLNGGKAIKQTHRFDLAQVQDALVRHIDAFEKHDERHNKDGKFRFFERKTQINASHLAVVAFVQDSKTKQILQAVFSEALPRTATD
ncbi:MAG: hypothetical protein IH602_07320 [Bryobacteraceae bacterium]|nr:hypothetical protein [Bryobacteraceae bacterium]